MPTRRSLLRTAGIATTGSLVFGGRVAAHDGGETDHDHDCGDDNHRDPAYGFDYAGNGIAPNPTEVKVRGSYAYLSTNDSVSVVDCSNPSLPVLVERAPAPGNEPPIRNWRDLKVGDIGGTPIVSMSQDNGNPGGVVIYDASDPENLERGRVYATGTGTHNHLIDPDRDVAYLTTNDPFTDPRIVIVDISGGLGDTKQVDVPVTRENVTPDDPVLSIFKLADVNEPMARAGINPAHEIFVERRGNGRNAHHVAHFCFWDAGLVSVDVSDPANPFAVAHFNALEDAGVPPRSTTEFQSRYIGMPGNTHYSKATPDGDYLFVGAEAYPDPTGTAIPEEHGDIKVFDLTEMNLRSPLNTDAPTYDPTAPEPVECIKPPAQPSYGALRTSHNFDFSEDGTRFYSAWYQGGIRAYDTSDPTEIVELASYINPNGNAFWGAQALAGEHTDAADDKRFAVGSDRNGRGIDVLELTSADSGSAADAPASVDGMATPEFMTGSLAPSRVGQQFERRWFGGVLDRL